MQASGKRVADPAPEADQTRYRSLVMLVVMMGVMVAAVDTTIVVLGLPVMMVDLHSNIISMVWVIMAYLLTLTMLSTQVGRFGDMFGRVRMYNLGFAVFTLGSLLCGLSHTGTQIVVFRIVQGIGGALISSNSGAIIADTIPASERGRAYGVMAVGWSMGAVLGILLGGVIVTFVTWRYIFFINLPIGLVALVISYRVLRERSHPVPHKLDLPGMGLLGLGLVLSLIALTNVTGGGWTTGTVVRLAIGVGLLAIFALWERRSPAPLVDISLLRQRVLTASILASFFQALGSYAVMFLVIMYLQGVRGLSPFSASLLLVPGYGLGGFLGPVSGQLADRYGARIPASFGLALQMLGILLYATLTVGSPLWVVVGAALVNGVGSSFFFPANNSAVMANAPQRSYGVASGLLRTFSNIGMVGSFAVALLAASAAIPRQDAFAVFLGTSKLSASLAHAFVHGLHAALFTSIGLTLCALVLSILRGKEQRRRVA